MEAQGPSRIVTRSHMMAIGQRVSRSCLLLSRTRVSRLRVFDAIRIDSGSIGEIRENTGIVSGGARSSSGYFEGFKIMFNNVLLFN